MKAEQVSRLVCITGIGAGDSAGHGGFLFDNLIFPLLLRKVYADKNRQEAITDLAYLDGQLIVAGLSSEEFASTLRSIPFPFTEAVKPTSVEIYHGAHGQFETKSPVRVFVPYKIGDEDHLLMALRVYYRFMEINAEIFDNSRRQDNWF